MCYELWLSSPTKNVGRTKWLVSSFHIKLLVSTAPVKPWKPLKHQQLPKPMEYVQVGKQRKYEKVVTETSDRNLDTIILYEKKIQKRR